MSFEDFIASLTQANLEKINQAFNELQQKRPIYTFSAITEKILRELFCVKRIFSQDVFISWFDADITLKESDTTFLAKLLEKEIDLIPIYNEEDLKAHFLIPILNRVDYKSFKKQMRDFYEETLCYENERFILKGVTDFIVAKGLEYPQQPYFFIQEFKKGIHYSNPEPQLLAEMIVAIEMNNNHHMKGAYIVGGNWHFVILNKMSNNQYQFVVSRNYDSTKIDNLKAIYKNLLAVKDEIISTL